jgi:hypothetical protein
MNHTFFATPGSSPQQTENLAEIAAFCEANHEHNMTALSDVAWQSLIAPKWSEQ